MAPTDRGPTLAPLLRPLSISGVDVPLVRSPLSTPWSVAVVRPARWMHERAEAWAVASQRRSRRNAMIASTRLAQRRIEAADVSDYLVESTGRRAGAGGGSLGTASDEVAHG